MRAVQQSARCANQPRSGGKFGKQKKQKNTDAVVSDLAPADTLPELSNSEMAGFLHHLNADTNLLYKMHSAKQVQKCCIQFNHHICPSRVSEKTL
jgi:hypothetical protein